MLLLLEYIDEDAIELMIAILGVFQVLVYTCFMGTPTVGRRLSRVHMLTALAVKQFSSVLHQTS